MSNKLFLGGVFGVMTNMLAVMFVLVLSQSLPPLWMAIPLPFFLTAAVVGMVLDFWR